MTTTATTRTLPTPPPVQSYPLPSSTKKDSDLKPNPHPYAIKSTTTGILTRSSSSSYNVNATRHYYIPPSPKPTRSDSSRHRMSKSLNNVSLPETSPTRDSPRPLPIPPELDHTMNRRDGSGGNGGNGGYLSADEGSAPRRRTRAETLPVISNPGPALSAPSADDLPDNPKLWTPSQLATYLTTALRMTSSGKQGEIDLIGLPALVAKDIATFVKSARIGGRTFLRLNEEDLEALAMNKKWRDALLAVARNLRQNVLKGRIWGVDGGSPATSPLQPASPPKIFANAEYNSSSSSINSSMSVSAGEEGDVLNGAALSRGRARRYRSGRVRGMVETFERSGSFSSDGGFEDEGGPAAGRASLRRWARHEGHATVTGQHIVESPSPSPSPSRRRPLPVPPSPSGSITMVADEEPTMEVLLAETAQSLPATGARAWEEMDLAPGVTVKRVPLGGETQAGIAPVTEAFCGTKTISGLGSGKSSGSSTRSQGDRRVVTAIFAPIATGADHPAAADLCETLQALPGSGDTTVPVANGSEEHQHEQLRSRPLPPTPGQQASSGETGLDTSDTTAEPIHLERLLEEEMLATRALLDTFRARLEIVEQKVADLEEKAALRERSPLGQSGTLHAHPQTHTQSQVDQQPNHAEIGVQSTTVARVDVETQSDAPSSDADDSGAGCVLKESCEGEGKPNSPAPSSTTPHSAISVSALQAVIPDVVRRLHAPVALFSSSSGMEIVRQKHDDDDNDDPATLSDLPSYVLLVGLGVCAVVLRVVLKRVVGKGGIGGFQP